MEEEARTVETAVSSVLDEGVVTGDIARPGATVYSTVQVGQAVVERIARV